MIQCDALATAWQDLIDQCLAETRSPGGILRSRSLPVRYVALSQPDLGIALRSPDSGSWELIIRLTATEIDALNTELRS